MMTGKGPQTIIGSARILVAEDDPDDQILLRRALRKLGLEQLTYFVSDGEEAVEYLENIAIGDDSHRRLPCLLILDLKMPRLDGFDVLEWIGSHYQLRRVTVVVLSGSLEPEDIRRATALGACDYLAKPQDPTELVCMLQRLEPFWAAGYPTMPALQDRCAQPQSCLTDS